MPTLSRRSPLQSRIPVVSHRRTVSLCREDQIEYVWRHDQVAVVARSKTASTSWIEFLRHRQLEKSRQPLDPVKAAKYRVNRLRTPRNPRSRINIRGFESRTDVPGDSRIKSATIHGSCHIETKAGSTAVVPALRRSFIRERLLQSREPLLSEPAYGMRLAGPVATRAASNIARDRSASGPFPRALR